MARTRRQTTSTTPDAREGRGVPVFLKGGGVVFVKDPAAKQLWREVFRDELAEAFERAAPALTPDRPLLERVAAAHRARHRDCLPHRPGRQ
jgi:hypothetical protein